MNKLQLLQTDSKELLERYLWDLSEQQKYLDNCDDIMASNTAGGLLQISVGYLLDKAVVEVSVIQAKNLPGKCELPLNSDRTKRIKVPILLMFCKTAQLNSYVEVHLLPNWLFKKGKKPRQTPVTKGTMNPYYGVEFQL